MYWRSVTIQAKAYLGISIWVEKILLLPFDISSSNWL
jgi:hypothetical protein